MTAVGSRFAASLSVRLDEADIRVKVKEFALGVVGTAGTLWIGLMPFNPPPLVGMCALPIAIVLTWFIALKWLTWRKARRMSAFTEQLELVLRMLGGALRIGLGLRQAIVLVTEETSDPARREFMRVIGRTNLGVSTLDAFEELATRMKSPEVNMMARAMRVQSQTGGDLAKVLDMLADTIRDRRRIFRKMRALTAQGRAGAYIIGALPVAVGSFIVVTQHSLAAALFHTMLGQCVLGTVACLEGAAILSLWRILQYDV